MNKRLVAFGLLFLLFALSACQPLPQPAYVAAANLRVASKSFSSASIPVTGGLSAGQGVAVISAPAQLIFASPRYNYSLPG